jgi:hypothetical protein
VASAVLALAPVAHAADGLWAPLPPPEYRLSGSAVYDRVHQRMIVFGGVNGFEERNDVWVLELATAKWRRLWPTGTLPSVRRLHNAVYDPVHDRMIVFGGGTYTGFWNANNEVWALELSGQPQWVKITPTGTPPIPRVASAAVYDSKRNRMLLFGGAYPNGSLLGDLWILNLNGTPAWTQLSPTSAIGPRAYAAAVLDSVRDRMVVMGGAQFGGGSGYTSMSDTWTVPLTGGVFTELATIGTAPTAHSHTAVFDPLHDQMVTCGGFDTSTGQYLQGAWRLRFSTATPTWTRGPLSGPLPPPGLGEAVEYDAVADAVRIFGGWGGNAATISQNTWTLALHPSPNWVTPLPSGTPPSHGRFGMCVAQDPGTHRMYMFGGRSPWATTADEYLNDVWVLDLGFSPVWTPLTTIGTPPTGRTFASMVYDPSGNRLVLYGGEHDETRFGDTWALSLTGTPTWSMLTPSGAPPIPRSHHGAIYDPIRDRMVMFGGFSLIVPYYQGDAWALSLSGAPAWTLLNPAGRGPSRRHSMSATLDTARDRMLLFGGLSDTPPILNRDTWALQLAGATTWDSIEVAVGPAGRREHEGVYDPVRDRLLVFGGYADDGGGPIPSQDLWSLSLAGSPAWTLLDPSTPIDPLTEHAAIFDVANDRLVSYGGVGAYNTTWLFLPGAALDAPMPVAARTGHLGATPNPFRGAVELSFVMAVPARAQVSVFDVGGRRVARLVDAPLSAGPHTLRWDGRIDGRAAPAGVYLARLESAGIIATARLLRIR